MCAKSVELVWARLRCFKRANIESHVDVWILWKDCSWINRGRENKMKRTDKDEDEEKLERK